MAEETVSKRGRPVGTRTATVELETLSFKVPAEFKAQLQAYAKQRRHSISELIREGVEWRIGEGDPLNIRYGTVASGETTYEGNTGNTSMSSGSAEVLREVQAAVTRLEAQLQAVVRMLESRAVQGSSAGNTGNTVNASSVVPTPMVPRVKPEKAEVIARLRQMRDTGLDNAQIARALQAEGVPNLSGNGQWHRGTVRKLLLAKSG